jgi:hypothetical protein
MSDQVPPPNGGQVPPPPSDLPAPPFAGEPTVPSPAPSKRRGVLTAVIIVVVLALVAAVIAVAATSGGSKSKAPQAAASPHMGTMTATASSPVEVDLQWSSTGGSNVQYALSRDGETLATLSGSIQTYKDQGVKPKTDYTYTVAVVDAKGHHSTPVTAAVTTPSPPPLGKARLDGRFRVKEKFLSENFTNFRVGQVVKEGWVLTPTCTDGACNTRLRLFRRGWRKTVLRLRRGVYSGKGTDTNGICVGLHVKETVTISIRVTRAKYVNGTWRATKFAGTLVIQGSPGTSCVTGASKQSVSGSLL